MYYITGTHGTGKSSIIEGLKKKFKHDRSKMFCLDSISRPVSEFDKEHNKMGVMEMQSLINKLILWYSTNAINQNAITARSVFDALAYTEAFIAPKFELSSTIARYYIDPLENFIFENSKHLNNRVFYVPIEFDLKQDGIRPSDTDYQKDIDKRIVNHLGKIDYFTITGSLEERIEKIAKIIRNDRELFN